jgi:hypothetical protein
MIDGSHSRPGKSGKWRKKNQLEFAAGSTWAARSLPPEAEEEIDDAFAGDRSSLGRAGRAVRKEERLPRGFPLSEAVYDGYYLCYSPCFHVQTIGEGEVCGRCGKQMKFIQDVEPV